MASERHQVAVWKYQLERLDLQFLWWPVSAKFRALEMQYGKPTIWAEVRYQVIDGEKAFLRERREVLRFLTGESGVAGEYLGMTMSEGGQFVEHWYLTPRGMERGTDDGE